MRRTAPLPPARRCQPRCPATVKLTPSIDQRSWRGAAAVRILRWPRPAANAAPDERLLGYIEVGKGGELVARTDEGIVEGGRRTPACRHRSLRGSPGHARGGRDRYPARLGAALPSVRLRRRAAHRRSRGISLHAGGRRTRRTAHAPCCAPWPSSRWPTPWAPKYHVRSSASSSTAPWRASKGRKYFAAHQLFTDEINALNRTAIRPQMLGDYDACAKIYQEAMNMALAVMTSSSRPASAATWASPPRARVTSGQSGGAL